MSERYQTFLNIDYFRSFIIVHQFADSLRSARYKIFVNAMRLLSLWEYH